MTEQKKTFIDYSHGGECPLLDKEEIIKKNNDGLKRVEVLSRMINKDGTFVCKRSENGTILHIVPHANYSFVDGQSISIVYDITCHNLLVPHPNIKGYLYSIAIFKTPNSKIIKKIKNMYKQFLT